MCIYLVQILALGMPISSETGYANTYHGYGWTYLLSETQDKYVKTVDILLDMYSSDMAFVQLLCDTPDEVGRPACEIASPKCLQALMARLHYFGRYEMHKGPVAHKSQNSIVRFAIDHHHLYAGSPSGANDAKGNKENHVAVALKFMKYREQFDREVQLRKSISFSSDFLIPLLSAHDGDADPVYKKETIDKGISEYPYVIGLAQAERDLHSAIQHEHFAGKDFGTIRGFAQEVLLSLQHLHDGGIVRLFTSLYVFLRVDV
jgi:hypothetical protein